MAPIPHEAKPSYLPLPSSNMLSHSFISFSIVFKSAKDVT